MYFGKKTIGMLAAAVALTGGGCSIGRLTSSQVEDTAAAVYERAKETAGVVEKDLEKLYNGEDLERKVDAKRELDEVSLLSVVDGDTIWVEYSDKEKPVKIRLIGIDTPESVHSDESKNTEYGIMASDHTKELLKDVETVFLEYDEEKEDQYGRTLAYVYLSDEGSLSDSMLNAKILADGYALDKVYEPNHKYADVFHALRTVAESDEKGLWATNWQKK